MNFLWESPGKMVCNGDHKERCYMCTSFGAPVLSMWRCLGKATANYVWMCEKKMSGQLCG